MTAGQARLAIEEAEQAAPPPDWLDGWAQGFCAGYDAAVGAERQRLLDELAETAARLDRQSCVTRGQSLAERRVARELAEMERLAVPVDSFKLDDQWPLVVPPGSGKPGGGWR